MKRLHIVVALLLVTLLLSACGAAPEAVTPAEEETAVETAAPVEAAEEPAPAPQKETATPEEPAVSEETPAASQQEPASAQQPETSTTNSTPSSGGTSGGGGDNPNAPIIGVIGSGGQSSGGTNQSQSSSGVVGVIGGQQTHVHSYSRQVVAPTCSEGGYTIFTCSCGESYTGNYTSATGQHRWVPDYEEVPVYEDREICVCNVCGKDITDMSLEQHYFGDGCFGSWRSVLVHEQVGTKTAIVSYHCGDCGAEW